MNLHRKQLQAALRILAPITGQRGTLPTLSHVRLTSTGSRVRIQATDLDTVATVTLAAVDGSDSPFDVVLPAKALAAAAKGSAKGAGTITVDGNRIGAGTIAGLPLEDWPSVVEPVAPVHTAAAPGTDFDARTLLESLAVVEHAISVDETRYHLNGAYIDPRGFVVATDGHRLTRAPLGFSFGADRETGDCEAADPEAGVILPHVAVTVALAAAKKITCATVRVGACGGTRTTGHGIARARGKVTLAISRADGLDVEITTLGIDGDFPEYDRVIPSWIDARGWDGLHPATELDAATVLTALAELEPYRNARRELGVEASLNGALRMRAVHPDVGEGIATVPTPNECPEVTFGVNADYVRDAMTLGDRLEFHVRDGLTQMAFRCGERLSVVMPMRV